MQEIKDTLGIILALQKDMQKDIGKLDQKIDNVETNLNKRIDEVEDKLNNKIDTGIASLRQEMYELDKKRTLEYKALDNKLDENLEEIGEMFNNLFSNVPA